MNEQEQEVAKELLEKLKQVGGLEAVQLATAYQLLVQGACGRVSAQEMISKISR